MNWILGNNLSFIWVSDQNKEPENSCLGDFFWKGEFEDKILTVSYFKKDILLFKFNLEELFSIIDCLSKVLFHTFLYNDFEILFFRSLLKDCINDLSIANLTTNENALAMYITKFVNENQCSINKVTLMDLFAHYIEEFKNIWAIVDLQRNEWWSKQVIFWFEDLTLKMKLIRIVDRNETGRASETT